MPTERPPSESCPASPADGPAVGMRRLLMLRRAPDYPAAHSMDTVWFAVDEAGHVAALWTGENGSLPTGLRHSDLLDELYRQTFQDNAEPHPDWDRSAEALGVFAYHYSDGNTEDRPVDVYQRAGTVAAALHVDQLPPDLRAAWKRFKFSGILFSEAAVLQPFEFFQCEAYDMHPQAYLAADGVTVRPIRGRERRFAAFVRQFRRDHPEEAARYRFEGVDHGR